MDCVTTSLRGLRLFCRGPGTVGRSSRLGNRRTYLSSLLNSCSLIRAQVPESTRQDGFIFWQGPRLTPRVRPTAEIQGFVDQTTASRSRSRSHCRIIFGYKVQFVFRDGFIQIADDIGTNPKASDGCALLQIGVRPSL
jgi:hypothetical protein